MKSDSLGFKFKNDHEECIARMLYYMVILVRRNLANTFDISEKGKHANYSGLCDRAVIMLKEQLMEYGKRHDINIEFHSIHGEQSHSPRLNSSLWPVQHTWAMVKIDGVTMYVDPTSSQFKRFYIDIPKYYISTREPKWYYPDSNNPVYSNKIVKWFNNKIRITTKDISMDGHVSIHKEGIVEYFQYEIWGKISDSFNRQHRPNVDKYYGGN